MSITHRDLGTLLIRADAGSRIGAGHVMRCLALAQAWQRRGGTVHLAAAWLPDALRQHLSSHHITTTYLSRNSDDANQTVDLAKWLDADWIVIDGYHFDFEFQKRIKASQVPTSVIDDDACVERYTAKLLLNQNLYASERMYAGRADVSEMLLGNRFVLLRDEFINAAQTQRHHPDVARRVLVTLGGADADNTTGTVMRAISQSAIPDLDVTVAVGAGNPHHGCLKELSRQVPYRVSLEFNSSRMAELMRHADVAISAAGSTCWEFAATGLPALVVSLAKNQRLIAEAVAEAGIAVDLGCHDRCDAQQIAVRFDALARAAGQRTLMSKRGRQLVDARGADRVVSVMLAEKEDEIAYPIFGEQLGGMSNRRMAG